MIDSETTWDKLLQIKTTGRDDSNADQYLGNFMMRSIAAICFTEMIRGKEL